MQKGDFYLQPEESTLLSLNSIITHFRVEQTSHLFSLRDKKTALTELWRLIEKGLFMILAVLVVFQQCISDGSGLSR